MNIRPSLTVVTNDSYMQTADSTFDSFEFSSEMALILREAKMNENHAVLSDERTPWLD